MTEEQVTQDDLELALKVVAEWHKQKGLAFAVVNSGVGVMLPGGNALELESALNHAHRMLEFDNGTKFMEIKQMSQGVQEARESTA